MSGKQIFLINDPELIRAVLVTDDNKFDKQMDAANSLLGKGLTASRADLHRRQRRLIQPGFRPEQIAKFAETMVDRAERAQSEWHDGDTLDVKVEMERIALDVLGATLLGQGLGARAAEISKAMTMALGTPPNMIIAGQHAKWLEMLPLPAIRRASVGRAVLHEVTDQLIRERRAARIKPNDLLTSLLEATKTGHGHGMSDQQLHDEVINLLIGGFETVSNALSWIWYRLSQHPESQKQLHQELDGVLGDRLPTFADIPALRYTQQIVRETLRLHPPLWIIWREALEDYRLNGYVAPAGAIVLMCQYLMHRNERFFSEPLHFKPERWTDEFRERLPKFAYFPFGGGSRQCVGDRFGFMEAALVLSTIAKHWRAELEPGFPVVEYPALTMRPKFGLRMIVHAR
jgi:cytochrome P450